MLTYPHGDLKRDIRLPAYHAAEWSNFAFGILGMSLSYGLVMLLTQSFGTATIIGLLFLRRIGVIGHRKPSTDSEDAEKPESQRFEHS